MLSAIPGAGAAESRLAPVAAKVATASIPGKGAPATVDLFRRVSAGELDDITKLGVFRPGGNSMEGKWFAETAEAAQQWGAKLGTTGGGIVTTRVPTAVADKWLRLPNLDGIGPARYAADLNELNSFMAGIRVLP